MPTVIAEITMSLDGYVTGPQPDTEHGLGHGGEVIHRWVFESHDSPVDRQILESSGESTGAVIMGRRTFDFVDGPNGWDDDINYAYDHDTTTQPPVFVVTHDAPGATRLQGFTFITDGIEAAVQAACDAAGERDVSVMGGAETIDRAIAAGVVDELRIHLSPVLMGNGTRLFAHVDAQINLVPERAVTTPHATHLTYRVQR